MGGAVGISPSFAQAVPDSLHYPSNNRSVVDEVDRVLGLISISGMK